MRKPGKVIAVVTLLFGSTAALAAPDTVASVRARAHSEIAQRDATIAALQQKVNAQQKQLDAMHQIFAEALQQVKTLRASLAAAGIQPPGEDNSQILDPGGYVFVPPPHAVPAYLMKYEKLIDKYVKLHPDVIPSVKKMNGHIEWVEVDDAQQYASANYYVNAYVFVTYPPDPVRNEMQIPNAREQACFDVNLNTGEIRYKGIF